VTQGAKKTNKQIIPKWSLKVSKFKVWDKQNDPCQQSTCQQLPVHKGDRRQGRSLTIRRHPKGVAEREWIFNNNMPAMQNLQKKASRGSTPAAGPYQFRA
jgi:hypothetical protein